MSISARRRLRASAACTTRSLWGLAAPVRACVRYLSNRTGSLDYQGALAGELPIGSGEIESAHRYIIQSRLKRAGTWWTADNLANMLVLRVLRANREWDAYWTHVNQEAA